MFDREPDRIFGAHVMSVARANAIGKLKLRLIVGRTHRADLLIMDSVDLVERAMAQFAAGDAAGAEACCREALAVNVKPKFAVDAMVATVGKALRN